jgi:phosphoheptose isomerase
MNEDELRRSVAQSLDTKRRFFDENAALVVAAGERIAASLRAGGRLYTFGNGGSAADAQHFASELVGRFQKERPALSAFALTTDASAVTAISNDFGFEHVFARQLEAAVLETIESGVVTKDLAAIAEPRPAGYVTTEGFITAIADRLRARVEGGLAVR